MGFLRRTLGNGAGGLMAVIAFGPAYYVGLTLLIVVLVALLAHAYRVWVEIHDVEESASPSELLESFEEAHAAGELDDQELARVRRLLEEADRQAPGPPRPSDRGKAQGHSDTA